MHSLRKSCVLISLFLFSCNAVMGQEGNQPGFNPFNLRVSPSEEKQPVSPSLHAQAISPNPDRSDRIVILKNGKMIEGEIEKDRLNYIVRSKGSVIRLPHDSVKLTCRDFKDGFNKQRAMLKDNDLLGHLRLGHWCVNNKNLELAKFQYRTAVTISPNSPEVKYLERRIKFQVTEAPQVTVLSEEQPGLEYSQSLETFVKDFPAPAVQNFTRKIQPIIARSCMTTNCHHRDSKKLKLTRPSYGKPAGRLLTLNNLKSIHTYLDATNPDQSPLLKTLRGETDHLLHPPGQPHIQYPTNSEQYKTLRSWVFEMAGKEVPRKDKSKLVQQPTDPKETTFSPDQITFTDDPKSIQNEPGMNKQLLDSQEKQKNPFLDPEILKTSFEESKPSLKPEHFSNKPNATTNTPLISSPNEDPFNPDAFNQKYHPARFKQEQSKLNPLKEEVEKPNSYFDRVLLAPPQSRTISKEPLAFPQKKPSSANQNPVQQPSKPSTTKE